MNKKRFLSVSLFFFMLIAFAFSQEAQDIQEPQEVIENQEKVTEPSEEPQEITFTQENIEKSKKSYKDYFFEELRNQIDEARDENTMVYSLFTAGPIIMSNEMKTTGLGFFFEYEHQVYPHISLKSRTRFTTFLTGYSDLKCLTAYTSLFVDYMPMSRQLRKLYVGIGGSVEGFIYTNSVEEIEGSDKAGWVFAVTPEVGYKMTAAYGIIIDMYVGYKWTYPINTVFYGSTKDFFGDNLIYGFNMHIPIKIGRLIKTPLDKRKQDTE